MKVLMMHNYYQQRGGEDAVFEAECQLLQSFGHTVETLTVHNDAISGTLKKLQTGLQTIYSLPSKKLIKAKIETFQPDIIHLHNFFPLLSPSIFDVTHQLNIPTVVTLHNYRLICPNALLMRDNQSCELCINQTFAWQGIRYGCYRNSKTSTIPVALMAGIHKLRKTWQNKVNQYIVLSEFSRQKFLHSSLQVSPEKIAVKPNVIFDAGVHTGSRQDYVVYLGRLSEEKGIQVVLETFEKNSMPIKIIGDGPFKPQVQEAASHHPHIQYLGYQEKQTALSILKEARALVFPSICYENFPLAVAEAFSTGTPVIGTNLGGIAELIQDGINGLKFTAGNTQDLQAKLEFLYSDDVDYDGLVDNARRTYLEKYTPEQNYQQLMDIYARAGTTTKV